MVAKFSAHSKEFTENWYTRQKFVFYRKNLTLFTMNVVNLLIFSPKCR